MRKVWILLSLLITVLLLLHFSCTDEVLPEPLNGKFNTIELNKITLDTVSYRFAKFKVKLSNDYDKAIKQHGVCYSFTEDPSLSDLFTQQGSLTNSEFISEVDSLQPDSTYYVKSYIQLGDVILYSEQSSIKTIPTDIPILTTDELTNILVFSAECKGEVIDEKGEDVFVRGFCWSKQTNPTLEQSDSITVDSSGLGIFNVNIDKLEPNSTYFVRTYAKNKKGVAYGNELSFTTKDGIPIIEMLSLSYISDSEISCHSNIVDDGDGLDVISRGICWSSSTEPTLTTNIGYKELGSGYGKYSANIKGLAASTTYYIRSYIVNELGTFYGNELTYNSNMLPSITTVAITDIIGNSAQSGGDIISDGGILISVKGVCWSTTENPKLSDSYTSNGAGLQDYLSVMQDLDVSTTYYVRAYATNSMGTKYGNQLSFTTTEGLPALTVSSIININGNSATANGVISSDGGFQIESRGMCWSLTENPTLADASIASGSSTGSYSSNILNLNTSTTYYVRAYATNTNGTKYCDQVSFTTTDGLPIVTTSVITDITSSSAAGGGNVSIDGGYAISERGVCWDTLADPMITDKHTIDGNGLGSFLSQLIDLENNKDYYVRAYATNERGTSYGNQVMFSNTHLGTFIDNRDGQTYNYVKIGSQIWMAENLNLYIPLENGSSYYNNDSINYNHYGRLYLWNTVMQGSGTSNLNPSGIQGVCPDGWHIPSYLEFEELVNYIGGTIGNAIKLKRQGTEYWLPPNEDANNETGFGAIPAGSYHEYDGYEYSGYLAGFWTSTKVELNVRFMGLSNDSKNISFGVNTSHSDGYWHSVRCVKD